MAETDIETNLPTALLTKLRKEQEDAEEIGEGLSLDAELNSSNGSKLVREVVDQLDSRIKTLMKQDPECQALLTLLGRIGTKTKRAKQLAERAVMEQLRMD